MRNNDPATLEQPRKGITWNIALDKKEEVVVLPSSTDDKPHSYQGWAHFPPKVAARIRLRHEALNKTAQSGVNETVAYSRSDNAFQRRKKFSRILLGRLLGINRPNGKPRPRPTGCSQFNSEASTHPPTVMPIDNDKTDCRSVPLETDPSATGTLVSSAQFDIDSTDPATRIETISSLNPPAAAHVISGDRHREDRFSHEKDQQLGPQMTLTTPTVTIHVTAGRPNDQKTSGRDEDESQSAMRNQFKRTPLAQETEPSKRPDGLASFKSESKKVKETWNASVQQQDSADDDCRHCVHRAILSCLLPAEAAEALQSLETIRRHLRIARSRTRIGVRLSQQCADSASHEPVAVMQPSDPSTGFQSVNGLPSIPSPAATMSTSAKTRPSQWPHQLMIIEKANYSAISFCILCFLIYPFNPYSRHQGRICESSVTFPNHLCMPAVSDNRFWDTPHTEWKSFSGRGGRVDSVE